MSRANFDRLAPPPRTLPTALRIQSLFGSRLAIAGWILLAFSSPFVWAFVLRTDLLSPVLFRADVDHVTGRVTSARATGMRDGRVPIHAVGYSYRSANGADLEGESYVTGGAPDVGALVTVEYLSMRPETSHIQGMRSATFGPGAIVIAIFPVIGAALAGLAFRSGWRRLELLSVGQVGSAELVSQMGTNMTINDRPVVRLHFEFAGTDGSRQRVSRMTATPDLLRDEGHEAILFDPRDPRRAVLVDELHADVSADLEGQLTTRPNAGLVIVIPLLTALGNVACAASRLLR